jgi:hypothetical protein
VLRTKSVYSPIDRKNDGLRILATRFRGRRMKTNRYDDVWHGRGILSLLRITSRAISIASG